MLSLAVRLAKSFLNSMLEESKRCAIGKAYGIRTFDKLASSVPFR